ncbi:MAG TPA: protein kinase [Thermoanaerobaculia bacterium]|nr:protein kinase [Thermoanaerobaculia bacterium]
MQERSAGRSEAPFSPGRMLGSRYRILSVLGYGGMGVVYKALDLTLDLEIALKGLRPDKISPGKRELLRREIILSRKVTHENVCRIYDLQEIDGVEYVSMEYIRGKALKDIEEAEGILPLGRGLSIAKGICRGLAAAHRIGVLHRDLKPENVIVDEEGRPRLMDFGIAIDRGQSWTERSGTVPGTPQFLAPELLRGAASDVRSDVYALGVLLFEMFTGRVPFDDPDTKTLVRKVLDEKAPDVTSLRPDFPPALAAMIDRLIAKDPEARFSSAEEVAAEIEKYEGAYLDHVLGEVSVARARSVKLMVILEANKALAATFDPTEILQIILRTATQETDAERGTIFLVEPETRDLVSQILEGGSVSPIRVPWGQGIAGACAAEGKPILTLDVAADPRHDPGPDSTSGFKTVSLLAVPMRTPSGEIAGVIEVLNKRRGAFTREDEEFLAAVADHAALAVESSRQHRSAIAEAAGEAREGLLRAIRPLLFPAEWPPTPGFDSAPLRWRASTTGLLGFDAIAGDGALTLFLAEDPRPAEEGIADLLATMTEFRSRAAGAPIDSVLEPLARRTARVAAARLSAGEAVLCASGAPLPSVFSHGRPVPFPAERRGALTCATVPLAAGDLVLVASEGLSGMEGGRGGEEEKQLHRAARLADRDDVSGAFMDLVVRWKAEGRRPKDRDVVILGARRI